MLSSADVASADIAEMIAEVESAITAADEAAEAEREKALTRRLVLTRRQRTKR
jgi:hypothetical protein